MPQRIWLASRFMTLFAAGANVEGEGSCRYILSCATAWANCDILRCSVCWSLLGELNFYLYIDLACPIFLEDVYMKWLIPSGKRRWDWLAGWLLISFLFVRELLSLWVICVSYFLNLDVMIELLFWCYAFRYKQSSSGKMGISSNAMDECDINILVLCAHLCERTTVVWASDYH